MLSHIWLGICLHCRQNKKGWAVNRRRTDKTMTNRKGTKGQLTTYKTLRKTKVWRNNPRKNCDELVCPRNVISSCSSSKTRRVTLGDKSSISFYIPVTLFTTCTRLWPIPTHVCKTAMAHLEPEDGLLTCLKHMGSPLVLNMVHVTHRSIRLSCLRKSF